MIALTSKDVLPEDGAGGTLVGRVWVPALAGPAVVAVRHDGVFDVSARFSTVSALCEEADPAAALRGTAGERIGDLEASSPTRRPIAATGQSPGCWRRSTCRP